MSKSNSIKHYVVENIPKYSGSIVKKASEAFGVSRTAVQRHVDTLIREGAIIKTGTTRNVQYYLSDQFDKTIRYSISRSLSEFEVYTQLFNAIKNLLQANVEDICHYGFTEMFNNAIDHSEGKKITVLTKIHENKIHIEIEDDGIGVFKKIHDYFKLEDIRESILQLTKGKTTTDPANHSGQGLFFTSRSFDVFEIKANGFIYIRNNIEQDWSFYQENSDRKTQKGTKISLSIELNSKRNIVDVFKAYQSNDDLDFDKTDVYVTLSKYNVDSFISRSQAKRVLLNLNKFKHITLDFKDVRLVGQGFVDEVFRVYVKAHPNITLTYVNANDDIEFMIKRSLP